MAFVTVSPATLAERLVAISQDLLRSLTIGVGVIDLSGVRTVVERIDSRVNCGQCDHGGLGL
jgi:hypothetical protein